MPGTDDADNNADVAVLARPSSRRSTQDEQIDLDYDEESNHGGSIEVTNSVDEKPEGVPEEKEEGELEDGELSSSDEEPEPVKQNAKQPISNGSPPRGKTRITAPSTAKPNETAWERGLREARDALRRANKVREEPDFEKKRLVAAPPLRRSSRNNTDSDHSPSPGPRRKNHSRSGSPRGIPSLLDIRTSPPLPPRRLPPKERRAHTPIREPHLRPIRRRSPSYRSRSRSRTPLTYPTTSPLSRRRHAIDLGPQVIYPNGRPCPKREGGPERNRDKRRDPSPRNRDRHDRNGADRTGRAGTNASQELRKNEKKLTVVSTSPISSDSDDSTRKASKGGRNGESISDPWARRRTAGNDRRRRRSSSSSSASNSDSSRSTIPGRRGKKKTSRSSSRSSSDSSDSDSDNKRKKKIARERSPPRGDISGFRIPKKKSARKEEDAVEAFFSKKKSDLPAAFRKRRRGSETGSGKKVKMEEVSGSESDSSTMSKSRTPPPSTSAFKGRKKPKSPSPISEDSDEGSPPPAPPREQLDDISPPPAAPSSPPAPIRSSSAESMDQDEKERRKQELLAQLREVENELAKRRNSGIVRT